MTKFIVEQLIDNSGFLIKIDGKDWKITTQGSYAVFEARVVGLSYAKYLQFIRDNYNGTITGKEGYSIVEFKARLDAERCAKFLNERLSIVRRNV